MNAAARHDTSRGNPKPPLRDHVAQSVRRYLRDLDGSDADNLYEIALREIEIPLFVEVLNHCEGNQSRAAADAGHPPRHAAQEAGDTGWSEFAWRTSRLRAAVLRCGRL